MNSREWKIGGGRSLAYGEQVLVMGIVNVTPDSFSDGGEFYSLEHAFEHAERLIQEGADILDIGGESTRPGSEKVDEQEEFRRVVPAIARLAAGRDTIISVDTSKASVARAAAEAGAAILNDISGLRFEPELADVAAETGAGLVLMHSRGELATLHSQQPVDDIMSEVITGLQDSIELALSRGVSQQAIAIDPGIGFGKSFAQNLELIGRLRQIREQFEEFPLLIGTSRKSFIGRLLGGKPSDERLFGSLATIAVAVTNGADIVRVHDVAQSVDTVRVAEGIRKSSVKVKAG